MSEISNLTKEEMSSVSDNLKWNHIDTIPKDGTEILLLLPEGVVSAWFSDTPATNGTGDDGTYDWICFDDMFTIDGHDNNILGWLPFKRKSK